MKIIDLTTDRCIVTGRKAKYFSGHVLALSVGLRNEPLGRISLGAGFASRVIADSAHSDGNGCYGEWKPADGIRIEDSWDDE